MINICTQATMCGMLWKDSSEGETWIQCVKCGIWLHEDCTLTVNDNNFIYDMSL